MTAVQVAPPYPVFTDSDGTPLDNGYLYFGEVYTNPETNPVQAYWDLSLTQPAAQPIRTMNGYPMRNGSPSVVYVPDQYSLTVRDSAGALVITSPVNYGVDPGTSAGQVRAYPFTGDGVTTAFVLGETPATSSALVIYITGVYQERSTYTLSGATVTFSEAPPLNASGEALVMRAPVLGSTADSASVTFTPGGAGGVDTTVQAQLRYFPTVRDFGATGTGDETAEFQAAIDSGLSPIFVPKDDYTVTTSSLTGQDRASGAAFIGLGPTINGIDQKHGLRGWHFGSDGVYSESYDLWLNDGFSTGVNDQLKSSLITLTAETDTSTTSDGTLTKTALQSTVNAKGAQHGNAARFNLYNYSTFAAANTCVYAHAVSDTSSVATFALHGETRHAGGTSIGISSENASYSASGSFYGLKVENTSGGGAAAIPHEITGSGTVKHDLATGILMSGTAGSDKGEWRYGIRFRDGSLRAADGEGIRFEDSNLYQIHSLGVATADIYLQGDSATGIILGGTYTSGNAMRLNAGQAIAWEATGSTKTYFDSGTSQLRTSIGGTDRVALEIDPSPRLLLNSTQVIQERITGWGAPTGTATRTTFATGSVTLSQLAERVHALIDDLTTHGLIGA